MIDHWPTYQDMDEHRHRAKIALTPLMVESLLYLPDDAKVVAFESLTDPLRIIVVIESEALALVPGGSEAPMLPVVPAWTPVVDWENVRLADGIVAKGHTRWRVEQ